MLSKTKKGQSLLDKLRLCGWCFIRIIEPLPQITDSSAVREKNEIGQRPGERGEVMQVLDDEYGNL
jgi:hypothetical protein